MGALNQGQGETQGQYDKQHSFISIKEKISNGYMTDLYFL